MSRTASHSRVLPLGLQPARTEKCVEDVSPSITTARAVLSMQKVFGLFAARAAAFSPPYRTVDNKIVDESGAELLFHGLNVIMKSAPYYPITERFDLNRSFAEEDGAILESAGRQSCGRA